MEKTHSFKRNVQPFSMLMLSLLFSVIFLRVSAQSREVTFSVDMDFHDVQEVGIVGSIKPLEWDKSIQLLDTDGDGVYEITLNFSSTDRYIKFKFVADGEMELEGGDARVLWFKNEPIQKSYSFNEYDYYDEDQVAGIQFSEEQIAKDVALLGEVLQYVHPAVYKFRDSLALQSDLEMLETNLLAEPNLLNAYKSVSQFAAKIKCSHAFTNPWNQGSSVEKAIFYQPDKLPLTFKRLGKRLFVDKNASDDSSLVSGLEILEINGISVDSILTKLTEYVTSDGNNYEKKLERLVLTGNEKFALFDIFHPLVFGSTESYRLLLKSYKSNEELVVNVPAVSKTRRTKILSERYETLETSLRDGWNFEILSDEVGKLTINSFAVQRNEFDWKAVIDQAFDELNEKEIPNLIIDIRENEGGQGEVGQYILQKIIKKPFDAPAMQASVRYLTIPDEYRKHINTWAKFPYDFTGKISEVKDGRYYLKQKYSVGGKTFKPKRDGYKGKVYLLTGASNSSATHLMAAFAQAIDDVTLVGQETGGNQMGTNGGFIFFLRLPNTRVEIDIPVMNQFVPPLAGEAVDGGIMPDVIIERTWSDLISGRDPEVSTVLELINK